MSKQESTPYWPNVVGVISFLMLLFFVDRGCTSMIIQREKNETSIQLEKEKTKQLEIKLKYEKK